ncbi:MAG: transglutaminase family protein [Planctomycetota bacterium]
MRRFSVILPLALLAAAPARGDDRPSRTFVFVYDAGLAAVPDGAKQVRLWIPVPLDNNDQKISNVKFAITSDGATKEAEITADGGIKNSSPLKCTLSGIGHGWGRTLCVESAGKPFSVQMSATVTRHETKGGGTATPEALALASGADKMVPLDGKAAGMADQVKDGADTTATARAIYDHVLDRMKYDKPAGQPWGRGDAEWACENCFGNCTDFHSYMMAIARRKGIPMRFEMGFNVPAGTEAEAPIAGYHCWAFFWDGAKWVPVDASDADKDPARADYLFGTLDMNRVAFTGGRDLQIKPAPASGALNFMVYPYCEVDGKETKDVTKAFKRLLAPPAGQ